MNTRRRKMSRVSRWISFVLESDVEELDLNFGWFGQTCYRLPHSVLVAKSLTVLTLLGWRLDSTSGAINLLSLKKLSLWCVYADDQINQNLLAGCPVIEFMKLDRCSGFECIKLFNVPNLLAIKVHWNQQLGNLSWIIPTQAFIMHL